MAEMYWKIRSDAAQNVSHPGGAPLREQRSWGECSLTCVLLHITVFRKQLIICVVI